MNLTKQNLYNLIFVLFLISLSGGSYMLRLNFFGIELYAFRYILIIGIAFMFYNKDIKLYTNKFTKIVFSFLLFWILYALISLFWCEDLKRGVHEIIYLIIGFLTYIYMFSLSIYLRNEFKYRIVENWHYTAIPLILMAWWEIVTGNHLDSNYSKLLLKLSPMHENHFVPITVFDNPNNFAIFLTISVTLFLFSIHRNQNKLFSFILFINSIVLIFITSSRIGIVYLFFLIIFFIGYLFIKSHKLFSRVTMKFFVFNLFFIASIFTINSYSRVNKFKIELETKRTKEILERYHAKIKRETGVDSRDSSSFNIRKNLIYNGIDFFKESKGIGIGAGSFEAKIINGENNYPTYGYSNPHNYFIRILSQYGVIVLLIFIGILIYVIFRLFVIVFIHKKSFYDSFFILLLLICFVLMSNANSSFIPLPLNWFLISFIFILFDALNQKYVEAN